MITPFSPDMPDFNISLTHALSLGQNKHSFWFRKTDSFECHLLAIWNPHSPVSPETFASVAGLHENKTFHTVHNRKGETRLPAFYGYNASTLFESMGPFKSVYCKPRFTGQHLNISFHYVVARKWPNIRILILEVGQVANFSALPCLWTETILMKFSRIFRTKKKKKKKNWCLKWCPSKNIF